MGKMWLSLKLRDGSMEIYYTVRSTFAYLKIFVIKSSYGCATHLDCAHGIESRNWHVASTIYLLFCFCCHFHLYEEKSREGTCPYRARGPWRETDFRQTVKSKKEECVGEGGRGKQRELICCGTETVQTWGARGGFKVAGPTAMEEGGPREQE